MGFSNDNLRLSNENLKPKKSSRRRWSVVGVLLVLGVIGALYAFLIEPNWIDVSRHHVRFGLSKPLKIAHLTDVHTTGLHWRERRLLELLQQESPDVIVLTGDTLGDGFRYQEAAKVLQQLHAPLGVWLVRGNWEYFRPVPNDRAFYDSVGIRLLVNESARLTGEVWLGGFDDAVMGRPRTDAVFPDAASGKVLRLALFHSPIFYEQIAGKCDLALAGHTHGGQVCLPLYGPLWLPRGCGNYLGGWYKREASQMYVSRGLGTSMIEVRFLCRPELAIITVE